MDIGVPLENTCSLKTLWGIFTVAHVTQAEKNVKSFLLHQFGMPVAYCSPGLSGAGGRVNVGTIPGSSFFKVAYFQSLKVFRVRDLRPRDPTTRRS